jgi:hypothetical protein
MAIDVKLTALTALSPILSTDLLYAVSDPGGTPASKKITVATLKTAIMGGTGTTNTLPKWTSSTALGNSRITDNGTDIGIDGGSGAIKLQSTGTVSLGDVDGVTYFIKVDPGAHTYTFSQLGSGIVLSTGDVLSVLGSSGTGNVARVDSPLFTTLIQTPQLKITNGGFIYPSADATTAIRIGKADGTTAFVTFDSTNKRVGINKTPGAFDLDVNGAVNLASTLAVTGASTFSGDVTHSGAAIIISGNISGSGIYGTSGIRIKGVPGTFTDTTSSGTVATGYTDVLGGNTLTASAATTITNHFTIYSKDPVAGTNVTLTNKWAIGGDSMKIGTSNQLTVSTTGVLTATSPVLTTPSLGVATATSLNGNTFTTGTYTLTGAASKTLTFNNSLTLSGTDSTTMTFPTTSATIARTDAGNTFTGVNSFTSPKITTGIDDANGNQMFKFTATASAVDGFTFTNAATANPATVTMAATGSDSNISVSINAKASGYVLASGSGLYTVNGASSPIGISENSNITSGNLNVNITKTGISLNANAPILWNSGSTTLNGSNDLTIGRGSAANFQIGAATGAGAAVAQTLSVQGSSGNSAAAALFTIAGSDQTGTTTTGGGIKIRGGNGTTAGGTVEIWTSATSTPAVVLQATAAANVKIAGTAVRGTTEGTNHLDIFNGTAPVGTLTNGISLYSASGELNVMDAAGNATLLSPHDLNTNEWIFYSKNTVTGKVLRIDMERLMKAIDAKLGGGFIREYVEAK